MRLFANMVEERTRDKIWKYSLGIALKNDNPVTPEIIVDAADVSERTARETLNVIAAAGWLKRDIAQDGTVRFIAPDDLEWQLSFLEG
jgi:predicted DNA-binding transcriptional regulator